MSLVLILTDCWRDLALLLSRNRLENSSHGHHSRWGLVPGSLSAESHPTSWPDGEPGGWCSSCSAPHSATETRHA